MKKILFLLAFSCVLFTLSAQNTKRASLTQTVEAVEDLQLVTADLHDTDADLQEQLTALAAQIQGIQKDTVNIQIPTTGGPAIKAPGTVEEANALMVILMGFVQFVLVGFVGKDKLPKWLSPFMLSILVAVVVTVVGITWGGLDLAQGILFFAGVSGFGNIIHQIKKPQKVTA